MLLFQEKGIAFTVDGNDYIRARRLASEFSKKRQAFMEDPASFAEPAVLQNELEESIPVLCDHLKQKLIDAWRDYTVTGGLQIEEAVLNILDTLDAYHTTIQEVRRVQLALATLANTLPTKKEQVENYDHLRLVLEAKWAGLQGSDLPTEILDFLRSLGAGSVELGRMTPAILVWLQKVNLVEQCYVSIKRQSR
jgi:hypothetical protein